MTNQRPVIKTTNQRPVIKTANKRPSLPVHPLRPDPLPRASRAEGDKIAGVTKPGSEIRERDESDVIRL